MLFAVRISYSEAFPRARLILFSTSLSGSWHLQVTISLSRALVSATYKTRASSSISESCPLTESASVRGVFDSTEPPPSYSLNAIFPPASVIPPEDLFRLKSDAHSHRKQTGNSSPFEWCTVISLTLSQEAAAPGISFSSVSASRYRTSS